MRFVFFILLIAISVSAWAFDDLQRQQMEARIKPIGQVSVQENGSSESTLNLPKNEAQPGQAKENPGQAIYEQYCSVCHRDGIAGAPKFREKADWQSRLDKKSLDELVASAVKGINAMPAKGTCVDCTEDDLKQAIQFMLPQS